MNQRKAKGRTARSDDPRAKRQGRSARSIGDPAWRRALSSQLFRLCFHVVLESFAILQITTSPSAIRPSTSPSSVSNLPSATTELWDNGPLDHGTTECRVFSFR